MSAILPWYDPPESHEERDPQWGPTWVIAALCAGSLIAL